MYKELTEKMKNYQPLAEEIQNIWQQDKITVVPVFISSTGGVPKNIHKHVECLQLNRSVYIQLQKSVVIDTTAIV
jgi:hypothetical protein